MPERLGSPHHPMYRELLAERRGRPSDADVRRHLTQCPICRDVVDFLEDEAGDDLDAPWLAARPATLPQSAIAGIVGSSTIDSAPARPRLVPAAPILEPTTSVPKKHRSWGWAAGPVGIAAAALLTVLTRDRASVQPAAPPPPHDMVAARRTPVPNAVAPASPAAHDTRIVESTTTRRSGQSRSVPIEDSSTVDASERRSSGSPVASFRLRETRGGLSIVLAASSATLGARQVQALDSAVTILTHRPDRRVIVRYSDPSLTGRTGAERLAQRAQDHLLLRGIEPGRIRLDRVQSFDRAGLPADVDAIELIVRQMPP